MRDDSDTTPEPAKHAHGEDHLPGQTTKSDSEHIPQQEIQSETEQTSADPDAIPELTPDADKNERIRQANVIMRQIMRLHGHKETGTHIAFTADLGIIIRVRALKERIGGDDFIRAAQDCGVGKNDAYDIVGLRLAEKIDDIKQAAELAKRKAEVKGVPFKYPDIKDIIKEFRPPKGDGGGEGGRSNRTIKEIRRENLDLSETNRLLTQKLSTAEEETARVREKAEIRETQIRMARDAAERRAEDAERRAIAAEARLAELLAANNNHNPKLHSHHAFHRDVAEMDAMAWSAERMDRLDLDAVHEEFDNYWADCDVAQAAYRLRPFSGTLADMKDLESHHGLSGWRGHGPSSVARQLRCDFLRRWAEMEPCRIAPERLTERPATFWAMQSGVLFDDLIAGVSE